MSIFLTWRNCKMKKIYCIVIILVFSNLIISCGKNNLKNDETNVIEIKRNDKSLENVKQYKDFLDLISITDKISYDEVLEKFGEPVISPETGIPFLIYEVYESDSKDKTIMLRLSFDMNNNVSKIEQVDQDGDVVKVILDESKDN